MRTEQWAELTPILTQGKTVKLQAIRGLCNLVARDHAELLTS